MSAQYPLKWNECTIFPLKRNECTIFSLKQNECTIFPLKRNECTIFPLKRNKCTIFPQKWETAEDILPEYYIAEFLQELDLTSYLLDTPCSRNDVPYVNATDGWNNGKKSQNK
jgi:hypothetical protein